MSEWGVDRNIGRLWRWRWLRPCRYTWHIGGLIYRGWAWRLGRWTLYRRERDTQSERLSREFERARTAYRHAMGLDR